MAAARSPTPIFVLRDTVDMGQLTDEPAGHGWTKIECASKTAYGCGEHGQEAVEGLSLYVRLGDDPRVTSSLAIRMSDDARRRFDSQLGGNPDDQMRALGVVQMAEEQDFTVILVILRRDYRRELACYLVYDHIGASLAMIKYPTDLTVLTTKPVPRRHGSSHFELFLMTCQSSPCDALCVCTTRANPASEGTGPWQMIERLCSQHEEIQEPFNADVSFSWQGKCFWADLSQGLVYCDLHSSSGAMDFGFIRLPPEIQHDLYQVEMDDGSYMEVPMRLSRTMGCVRDSICFVCIDGVTHYANDWVKMWTLKLPPQGNLQEARWEMVKEVPVRELWGLDSFKESGLPEGPLEYPVLTPDGDLSVILADQSKLARSDQLNMEEDICVFDMSLKRLRWHGLVRDYHFTDHIIFPSSILRRKHGSRKRRGPFQFPPKEAWFTQEEGRRTPYCCRARGTGRE